MKTEPNDPVHSGTEERKWGSEDQHTAYDYHPGITIREYYAGQIMANMAHDTKNTFNTDAIKGMAQNAVVMADALIEALNN